MEDIQVYYVKSLEGIFVQNHLKDIKTIRIGVSL